ncbi:SDR family oxidoreductase [Chitinibacter sp. SCUT-21]|uniref:SDR family NAD(P)-dependent oxidoreductase n=1 Tax=Chitinibacter sp. SCUT-21 TaxID=2970891 RepID=UPI0035A66D9D
MKTAFITGATSGIGLAMAQQLSQQGYALIIHGRDARKLSELQKTLPNVRHTIVADLAELAQQDRLLAELAQYPGQIDVAINNAGFGLYGKCLELSASDVDAMLAVNQTAVLKLSRYFARRMSQQGGGHILNVASTAAYQPQPFMAAYAASKAFVAHFTEAFAMEMKPLGVHLMVLSPGRTDTGFFKLNGRDLARNGHGTFAAKHRISPATVARIGLRALFKGQFREIPTFENKLYVFLNRLLPKTCVLNIYHKAMQNT